METETQSSVMSERARKLRNAVYFTEQKQYKDAQATFRALLFDFPEDPEINKAYYEMVLMRSEEELQQQGAALWLRPDTTRAWFDDIVAAKRHGADTKAIEQHIYHVYAGIPQNQILLSMPYPGPQAFFFSPDWISYDTQHLGDEYNLFKLLKLKIDIACLANDKGAAINEMNRVGSVMNAFESQRSRQIGRMRYRNIRDLICLILGPLLLVGAVLVFANLEKLANNDDMKVIWIILAVVAAPLGFYMAISSLIALAVRAGKRSRLDEQTAPTRQAQAAAMQQQQDHLQSLDQEIAPRQHLLAQMEENLYKQLFG